MERWPLRSMWKELARPQRLRQPVRVVEAGHLLVTRLGVEADDVAVRQLGDEAERVADRGQEDVAAWLVGLGLERDDHVVAGVLDVLRDRVDALGVPLEGGVQILRAVVLGALAATPHDERGGPSSAARSTLRSTLRRPKRRTDRSFAVKPPSLKTGWLKVLVVIISMVRPRSPAAVRKRSMMAERSSSAVPNGTTSSSWKVMPAAPASASGPRYSHGSSEARLALPNWSFPGHATVQSPKENLSSGVAARTITASFLEWSRRRRLVVERYWFTG